jgi:hypothetical protein
VRQQLFRRQIARLAPVEDRLSDVRGDRHPQPTPRGGADSRPKGDRHEFAPDSPLEEAGFEPLVPPWVGDGSETPAIVLDEARRPETLLVLF